VRSCVLSSFAFCATRKEGPAQSVSAQRSVQAQAERVPRRVEEHPEGCTGLVLVLGSAEVEHCRLGAVEVVHDHVEMHLLGHLLSRPCGRVIGLYLLEGDALTVLRADVNVVGEGFNLPIQHGAVESRESGRIGTVDDDAREACDSHTRHATRDCGRSASGLRPRPLRRGLRGVRRCLMRRLICPDASRRSGCYDRFRMGRGNGGRRSPRERPTFSKRKERL